MDGYEGTLEHYWQRTWLELQQSGAVAWNDSTRLEFEQRYAAPFQAAMNHYLASLKRLDEIVVEIGKFAESLE